MNNAGLDTHDITPSTIRFMDGNFVDLDIVDKFLNEVDSEEQKAKRAKEFKELLNQFPSFNRCYALSLKSELYEKELEAKDRELFEMKSNVDRLMNDRKHEPKIMEELNQMLKKFDQEVENRPHGLKQMYPWLTVEELRRTYYLDGEYVLMKTFKEIGEDLRIPVGESQFRKIESRRPMGITRYQNGANITFNYFEVLRYFSKGQSN